MTRIKTIQFLKVGIDQFDCNASLENNPTSYQGFQMVHKADPYNETIELLTNYIPGRHLNHIDFSQNIDTETSTDAKTHFLYSYANEFLGKVSIKEGNYPPPYRVDNKSEHFVNYDQHEFSSRFEVNKLLFTLGGNYRYKMSIELNVSNNSAFKYKVLSDKIAIGETTIDEEQRTTLFVGIEKDLNYNGVITVVSDSFDLNINEAIGIVLVKYEDGGYNLNYQSEGLMKKGVIEL